MSCLQELSANSVMSDARGRSALGSPRTYHARIPEQRNTPHPNVAQRYKADINDKVCPRELYTMECHTYTTHNKLRILGLIFVQFIYLIFLVTEIFVTAKMSNYDQNKTLDMKIQHLLDVRNYTRSRTPPN